MSVRMYAEYVYVGAYKTTQTGGSYKPWFLASPWYRALEPECRIPMCILHCNYYAIPHYTI